jgi:hypothetical protein
MNYLHITSQSDSTEADLSPRRAYVTIAGICTPTPPYVFVALRLAECRDIFSVRCLTNSKELG